MPEVLRPYIRGQPEFFEYTKELPKDSTSLKVKGKADKGAKPKIQPAADVDDKTSKDMSQLKV